MINNDELVALDLDVGSDEWREFRKGDGPDEMPKVGGSTISKIMGLNPYVGPHDLWLYMTGRASRQEVYGDEDENEALWWGKEVEPLVLKRFQEQRPDLNIYPEHRTFQSTEHPWMTCSPDGFAEPTNGDGIDRVIEAKCKFSVWRQDFKIDIEDDASSDDIPFEYLCQAQWNAGVLGLPKTVVPARLTTNKESIVFNVYEVDFDPDLFKSLKDRAEEFILSVQNDEEPDSLTEQQRGKLLDQMYESPESEEVKEHEKADILISEYREVKDEIDQIENEYEDRAEEQKGDLEKKKDRLENEIKSLIGEDEGVKGESFRALWRPQKRWYIGQGGVDLLREEYPDVFEELTENDHLSSSEWRTFSDAKLD